MATKEQLQDMIKALMPILEQIEEFQNNYGDILKEYKQEHGIMTEEERVDAAAKMLRKYSNL